MAFNIYHHNDEEIALLAEIARWDPDVLLLIETNAPAMRLARPALLAAYPHHHAPAVYGHAEVFSRLPLQVPRKPSADHGVQQGRFPVRVRVAGRAVAVFGVHPISPTRRGAVALNRRQHAELAAAVAAERAAGRAVVVAGDHNATARTANLAVLTDLGLVSSFGAAGRGRSATWPAWLPDGLDWLGIRIDHVHVTPDLAVVAHQLGATADSDHRPVIADLRVER